MKIINAKKEIVSKRRYKQKKNLKQLKHLVDQRVFVHNVQQKVWSIWRSLKEKRHQIPLCLWCFHAIRHKVLQTTQIQNCASEYSFFFEMLQKCMSKGIVYSEINWSRQFGIRNHARVCMYLRCLYKCEKRRCYTIDVFVYCIFGIQFNLNTHPSA